MTKKEFDEGYDGLHVPLTCEDHPDLRWSCKVRDPGAPDGEQPLLEEY